MPRSLHDELMASTDPLYGRRTLDQMECGAVRRGKRSRRVSARMVPPGSQPFARWLAERGYPNPDEQKPGVGR